MKALLKKEQFLVQFEIVSMNAVKCREKMVGSRNALRWSKNLQDCWGCNSLGDSIKVGNSMSFVIE